VRFTTADGTGMLNQRRWDRCTISTNISTEDGKCTKSTEYGTGAISTEDGKCTKSTEGALSTEAGTGVLIYRSEDISCLLNMGNLCYIY